MPTVSRSGARAGGENGGLRLTRTAITTIFPIMLSAAIVLAALLMAQVVLPAYPLVIFSYALVFAIACMGMKLVFGSAGLLSLGHATFFALPAYAGAFLCRFTPVTSFEVFFTFGVAFGLLVAAAIGFLCTRATRIHFTILTLAFCQIVYSLFFNGTVFRLFGPEGWALFLVTEGGMYIPRLTLLGIQFAPHAYIPAFYNIIVVIFVGAAVLLWRLDRSPFGMALRAIRDNEKRARAIGIPVRRYRWRAFVLSAAFVGVAGALYGQLARQITPEQLHWLFSAKLILATVLGGARDFLGPIFGALVFVGLEEAASGWTTYHDAALGILLIAVVFLFPAGLAGVAAAIVTWLRAHNGRP